VKNDVFYEAVVLKRDGNRFRVHFNKWNSKFDEWIHLDEERIAPHKSLTKTSKEYVKNRANKKGKRGKHTQETEQQKKEEDEESEEEGDESSDDEMRKKVPLLDIPLVMDGKRERKKSTIIDFKSDLKQQNNMRENNNKELPLSKSERVESKKEEEKVGKPSIEVSILEQKVNGDLINVINPTSYQSLLDLLQDKIKFSPHYPYATTTNKTNSGDDLIPMTEEEKEKYSESKLKVPVEHLLPLQPLYDLEEREEISGSVKVASLKKIRKRRKDFGISREKGIRASTQEEEQEEGEVEEEEKEEEQEENREWEKKETDSSVANANPSTRQPPRKRKDSGIPRGKRQKIANKEKG